MTLCTRCSTSLHLKFFNTLEPLGLPLDFPGVLSENCAFFFLGGAPEVAEPEAAQPGAAEPGVAKPGAAEEPGAAEPGAADA